MSDKRSVATDALETGSDPGGVDGSDPAAITAQRQTMTEVEWQALGQSLFGADLTKWRFRCPTCGNVMSIEKARTLPAEQLAKLRESKWNIEQECVGRYIAAGCDWCAYGLFSGPFFVVRDSGSKTPVFGFDTTRPTQED